MSNIDADKDYTITTTAIVQGQGASLMTMDELTGEHETFEIDHTEFGWRYFDDEKEASLEHLKNFKAMGRWFSQMAIAERPQVIKQWRELASSTDYEWLDDFFIKKLYSDDDMRKDIFSE